MAATSLNAEQLRDAFQMFNQQSGLLEESYRDLQDSVSTLTVQLRREHTARLQELIKKEKLARRLSELLETLPGAILVLDGDGVIRQKNSQAETLLKRPLIGCSWASIVAREVRDGGNEDGNIQLRDERCLNLSRRPLKSEPGEILLLADVTESRQISELLQRRERLTIIGEMTADFAHQVRTPLASAMLYAAQIETSRPSQARVVSKIMTALHDLKCLVSDMLGFAAGARGSQEDVDVSTLLYEVQQSIDGQLSMRSKVRVSAASESLMIAANKAALKGALLNLITNADQACEDGANILLHANRDGDSVFLCVTDDGPGIADTIQPQLFDPFFTTRPQGTGLGLSIVKAIAVAHGGDVTVATSSRGSSFSIKIPAPEFRGENK